jgi:ribonuclease R
MAGLHDRILKTLGKVGAKGISKEALLKRLYPVYPPAIAGGIRKLVNQGKAEELANGNFILAKDPSGAIRQTEAKPPRKHPRRTPQRKALEEDPPVPSKKLRIQAEEPEPTPSRRRQKGSRERTEKTSRAPAGPTLEGRLAAIHRDGYGFVTPDDSSWSQDIFIPPGRLAGALTGDRVRVGMERGVKKTDARFKGDILEVLERIREFMTGFLEQVDRTHYQLMPTDPSLGDPLAISPNQIGKAKSGEVVLAKILEPKKEGGQLRGKVVEVLGQEGDPALDTELLIQEHAIRNEWPPAVLAAAEGIPTTVPEEDRQGRLDLREQPCFTIDGRDARDLDDAVYLEKLEGGLLRLWVHIADVSHYVRPGDVVDEEAVARGTSVYFPDRVIPMLPQALSNGICSLHPEVERLALSARMDFDSSGERQDFKIFSTVIRSHYRLNYQDVHAACIEGRPEIRDKLAPVLANLETMFELAAHMRDRRKELGYLDFALPSVKVKVNELGEPVSIQPVAENLAYGLIEQFMVAANEAVSDWMVEAKKTFVFRIHENPDRKKLAELADTARRLGIKPGKLLSEDPAKALQAFLEQITGKPEENILRIQTLRCMKLAEYSHKHRGHFGLGSTAYTHFTSPIRRYPDLIVHRLLKDQAHIQRLGKKQRKDLLAELPDQTRELSRLERKAEAAEREAIRIKKMHFLKERVGDVYQGTVVGVTHFGLFVELEDVMASALLHISNLGKEYFHFKEETRQLIGNESGKVFSLGDLLWVKVHQVNLRERKVMVVPSSRPVGAPR